MVMKIPTMIISFYTPLLRNQTGSFEKISDKRVRLDSLHILNIYRFHSFDKTTFVCLKLQTHSHNNV